MCNMANGLNVIDGSVRLSAKTVRTIQVKQLIALMEFKLMAINRRIDVRNRIDLYTHTPGELTPLEFARRLLPHPFLLSQEQVLALREVGSVNRLPLLR